MSLKLDLNRLFKGCSQSTVDLPVVGEATILSLVLFPFCVAFAIFWAARQKASYAWIFQDILVRCLYLSFSFMEHFLRIVNFC